ncbi:MAG: diadenylate cyclase [Thermoguttaceae bacterium]|nr:diadenylate cyclase [Thermoguttaceae bacterium]
MVRFGERFKVLWEMAVKVADAVSAQGVLLLVEGTCDWSKLAKLVDPQKVLLAVDSSSVLAEAQQAGFRGVAVELLSAPLYDRLTQALLEAVADELLAPGATVVALYSGFHPEQTIDTISIIQLEEHLEKLSSRELRQLETQVPLETLKLVVDLAVEIGREGREGQPIGTMFIVGDTRKVLAASRPVGFDPVRGYSRAERNLFDPRVREGIKEIAQLDGAIIVSSEGIVEAACRYVDSSAADVTLSKGLGARHWAAAAISRATKAIAITVSKSNGTVRIFQNGEVVLRIEPQFRRPMVWREFEYEPPLPEPRSKPKLPEKSQESKTKSADKPLEAKSKSTEKTQEKTDRSEKPPETLRPGD